MNAGKPSSKRQKARPQEPKPGVLRAMFQDLFAHGIAMPVLLFGVSTVISCGGVWACLEEARHAGDAAPLWKFAAALMLFSQWIANCVIMRVRRKFSLGMVLVYLMAASLSGFGVYHMSDVVRSAGYKIELQASEDARRPYNQIITENTQMQRAAQQRILEISQQASAGNWPGERVERQSAPSQAVVESATAAIAAAQTQLAALGEPMSPTRPRDFIDVLFAIASAVAVLLEGVSYFNMTSPGEAPTAVKKNKAATRERRLSVGEVLAIWLSHKLLAPAAAAALVNARVPAAAQRAPMVNQQPAPQMQSGPPSQQPAEVVDISTARQAAAALGRKSGEARRRRIAERASPANDQAAVNA